MFFHNIGDDECDATGDTSNTVYQNIRSFQIFVDEIKRLEKIGFHIEFWHILGRYVQIVGQLGLIIGQETASGCSDDSPDIKTYGLCHFVRLRFWMFLAASMLPTYILPESPL